MFTLVLKQERRHRKRFAFARDLPGSSLAPFKFYKPFSERGIYLALRPVRKKPERDAIQSAPCVVFSKREIFPFHDRHFTANRVKFPVVLRGSSRLAKSRDFFLQSRLPNVSEVARFFLRARSRKFSKSRKLLRSRSRDFFAGAVAECFYARGIFCELHFRNFCRARPHCIFFFIDIVIKLPFATRQKFESE